MSEKRFIRAEDSNGLKSIFDNEIENGKPILVNCIGEVGKVVDLLNELNEENDVLKQQLKTKYVVNKQYEELQRLKKDNKELKAQFSQLEEEKDSMNLFIKQTIEPLLWNCVFELNTIESMSQVELAKKIEDEIIPFIQDFKYLKYESPEEEKQDKSE